MDMDIECKIEGLDQNFNYLKNEVLKHNNNANMYYKNNNEAKAKEELEEAKNLKELMLDCAEEVVELSGKISTMGLETRRIIDGALTYLENNKPHGKQPGQDD